MADKSRSRNYPAFGLDEAISKARLLYERDKRATVGADIAVQAWGYKGINGASLRTLGAVRQYGLLDAPSAKQVKLSHRALTIILEPDDSAERAEAIRAAGTAPAMFKEIRDQYPDGLPSDPAIVSWLVRTHNFGDQAATDLISSYRDTLALVEKVGGHDIPSSGKREVPPSDPPPKKSTGGTPETGDQHMEFTWPLSGNATATLTVTKALDSEDIETLTAYFEIAKKALGKAAKESAKKADAAALEEMLN